MTRAVVLDIEGTTSSTRFVTSTLFPYARERYADYVRSHRQTPELVPVLDDVRREIGEPAADEDRVVATLEAWTDADAKVTALKTLQGWIWQEGFASGDLVAHFFPDVIPALRRWRADGIELAVFSSGSVDAQRAWFSHSPEGDLLPLLSANFDTGNAGPKFDADSYRTIAAHLRRPPGEVMFLSDVRAELDAARSAGWDTVGVRRAGEPGAAAGLGDHREIHSFDELDLASTTLGGPGPARPYTT